MLNYDDCVYVKIIKVKDEFGIFSHWEYEVRFDDEESYAGGGTGPTFHDAFDGSFDAIRNAAHLWILDDANNKKNE